MIYPLSLHTYSCQNKAKSAIVAPKEKRKAQTCCFCKNHGFLILKKDHKNRCKHRNCNCELCLGTKHRQLYSAREKRKNYPQSKINQNTQKGEGRQRKEQQCRKCLNHEKFKPMKDHKKVCPFRNCNCEACDSTIRRRKHVTIEAKTKRQRDKNYQSEIKAEDVEMEVFSPSSTIFTESDVSKLSPCSNDFGYESSSPTYFPSETAWNELPPIDELLESRPQAHYQPQIIYCFEDSFNQNMLRNLQHIPTLPELTGNLTLI